MILVETTYWPLVVVGAIPDTRDAGESMTTVDEDRLWSGGDVRLAVVIRGDHSRAWVAQEEVFKWLGRHRTQLWRCVFRVAWIFEDELMRRSAERWLSLVGDRLFRGEMTTFRSVQSAVSWLATDAPDQNESRSEGTASAWGRYATG